MDQLRMSAVIREGEVVPEDLDTLALAVAKAPLYAARTAVVGIELRAVGRIGAG
jgi:hypothetical protein